MKAPLLSSLSTLPASVERGRYDPTAHGTGIVHLGFGAFHRSHQAFYTDAALEVSGGNWRICGASLRDTKVARRVNRQNGLYSLITKRPTGTSARIISSVAEALSAVDDSRALQQRLCSPDTRIVSLTITEKGYGIDRTSGGVDLSNPIIAHDLESPEAPRSAIGYIVNALQQRREQGDEPFTLLSCDNLPNNGSFLRQGVLDFAQRRNTELAHWIADHVLFPATMVDRITPAQSPQTLALAEQLTGHRDYLAIEAEPFHQWVVEDSFANGRPDWEAAGALFTDNVAPYEAMKLRMLNGAHSMLAYAGFLSGHSYVRDVMTDKTLVTLIDRHMQAASRTLVRIPGYDFKRYASELLVRFTNPKIAHETAQIAMDGSQKLPQRILEPAVTALERGEAIRPFAFAAALWMYYCRGSHPDGHDYTVQDPIAPTLQKAACRQGIRQVVNAFAEIPGLIPAALSSSSAWTNDVFSVLNSLYDIGVRATLEREAGVALR